MSHITIQDVVRDAMHSRSIGCGGTRVARPLLYPELGDFVLLVSYSAYDGLANSTALSGGWNFITIPRTLSAHVGQEIMYGTGALMGVTFNIRQPGEGRQTLLQHLRREAIAEGCHSSVVEWKALQRLVKLCADALPENAFQEIVVALKMLGKAGYSEIDLDGNNLHLNFDSTSDRSGRFAGLIDMSGELDGSQRALPPTPYMVLCEMLSRIMMSGGFEDSFDKFPRRWELHGAITRDSGRCEITPEEQAANRKIVEAMVAAAAEVKLAFGLQQPADEANFRDLLLYRCGMEKGEAEDLISVAKSIRTTPLETPTTRIIQSVTLSKNDSVDTLAATLRNAATSAGLLRN